jgi:hypothetical protein
MSAMQSDPVEALILDFIEWLAFAPRDYAETIGARRTSCPRLPVWEEAVERGYVARRIGPDGTVLIQPGPTGYSHLAAYRA